MDEHKEGLFSLRFEWGTHLYIHRHGSLYFTSFLHLTSQEKQVEIMLSLEKFCNITYQTKAQKYCKVIFSKF